MGAVIELQLEVALGFVHFDEVDRICQALIFVYSFPPSEQRDKDTQEAPTKVDPFQKTLRNMYKQPRA
ncbi:hypothetical protein RRF57_006364 [Xylaria bambusicola]|uniref:Uncharacterized protein n=1 Tax=Xylaria bambusicola TaxID=326684 RepID=A0AAN7UZ93_9PEZI